MSRSEQVFRFATAFRWAGDRIAFEDIGVLLPEQLSASDPLGSGLRLAAQVLSDAHASVLLVLILT